MPRQEDKEADQLIFERESAQLRQTRAWIQEAISKLEALIRALEEDSIEIKTEAWEGRLDLKDNANIADNAVAQAHLRHNVGEQENARKRILEYKKILDKPYFGKIRFRYLQDEEAEDYYIGLRGIYDDEACESLVLDWRSPLASLYYEDALGPVSVPGPKGDLEGELLDKLLLSIARGELLAVEPYYGGNSDEVLAELLSRPSDAKMREIVSSLQKQQNTIVRQPSQQSFLLLGKAGSGKTSIALHRAAWLLYQRRFDAGQILFVSPSRLFGEYVQSVLPSLGEDNLSLATIQELQTAQVEKLDPRFSSYSYGEAPVERLNAAASLEFAYYVEAFIAEKSGRTAADLATQASEAERQLPGLEEARETLDLLLVYREFLASPGLKRQFPDLYEPKMSRRYDRLDLAILARMAQLLDPRPTRSLFCQAIVDEAQDLLLLEHIFLHQAHPCPSNLFADESQAIRFQLPADYIQELSAIYQLAGGQVFSLLTTYRSSYEIMEFAKQLLDDPSLQPFHRHGVPVKQEFVASRKEQLLKLPAILADFYRRGARRIALICRTDAECEELCYAIKTWSRENNTALESGPGVLEFLSFPWPQLLPKEQADQGGVLEVCFVTPYAAKGLEFDAVLLADASKDKYQTPQEQRLLYVASTRALHQLHVLSVGEPSPYLPKPKEEIDP